MYELNRFAPWVAALLATLVAVACAEVPEIIENSGLFDDPLLVEDDKGAVTEVVPVSQELVAGLGDDARVHLDLRVDDVIYVLDDLSESLASITVTCPSGERWTLADWLNANGLRLAEKGQVTAVSGAEEGRVFETMEQIAARMAELHGCVGCEFECVLVDTHASENICWSACPAICFANAWDGPSDEDPYDEWPWWLEPTDNPLPLPGGPDPSPEQGNPTDPAPDGGDGYSDMPPPPMPGGGGGSGGTPTPSGSSGGSGSSGDSSGGSGGHSGSGGWDW